MPRQVMYLSSLLRSGKEATFPGRQPVSFSFLSSQRSSRFGSWPQDHGMVPTSWLFLGRRGGVCVCVCAKAVFRV